MSTTGLGIFLGALGSVAINSGNNLQSLGMAQLEAKISPEIQVEKLEDEPVPHEEIDACQSKTWVVGTTIFITGSLLNFSAFAFAPQSILASLEGIQFVTNVLFGKFVLGKEISSSMWAGTAMTIVGVVVTVLSASVVGTLEADFEYLLFLWGETGWIVYLVMTAAFGVLLQGTHQVYLTAKQNGKPLPHSEYVLPITYATFSALFGTMSVVFAKILSELVTLQIVHWDDDPETDGQPIFVGSYCWFTYMTLGGWLFFVGVWLFRMNEALSLYDPLFIIPLLQMNFILFAIISGGIYFKEFDEFGVINWMGFVFGVALLFGGIYLLSPVDTPPEGEGATEPGLPFETGNIASLETVEESAVRPYTPVQRPQAPPGQGTPSPGGSRRGSFQLRPGLPYLSLIPPRMRSVSRQDSFEERTFLQSTADAVSDIHRVISALGTPKQSPRSPKLTPRRDFRVEESKQDLGAVTITTANLGSLPTILSSGNLKVSPESPGNAITDQPGTRDETPPF